jgi:hypothetical protein
VRRQKRYYVLAAALAAAAGLGAGLWLLLGGGAAKEPARSEYLAHVSLVCRTYAHRLERIPAPSDPAAYGNVISSVRQVLPLLRAQAAAMRAVPPPAALEPRLERLFGLDRRSVAALRPALAAARRRDAGGVATGLLRFSSARDQVHRLAVAIGIDCTVN